MGFCMLYQKKSNADGQDARTAQQIIQFERGLEAVHGCVATLPSPIGTLRTSMCPRASASGTASSPRRWRPRSGMRLRWGVHHQEYISEGRRRVEPVDPARPFSARSMCLYPLAARVWPNIALMRPAAASRHMQAALRVPPWPGTPRRVWLPHASHPRLVSRGKTAGDVLSAIRRRARTSHC